MWQGIEAELEEFRTDQSLYSKLTFPVKLSPPGDWSAEMPRCDLFGCVTTDAVQNGTVASDIIPLKRESRIVCQEGFQLEGMVAVYN